jgi:F-type H+-transporting ATPase subunit b
MTFFWKIVFLVSIILWPQIGFTEGDGLPQMDITTFPSQLFWLIITFGILYLFMWRTAIPKLRNTIEERQDKILLDINEAEKLKSEAEETLREYEEKNSICF